MTLKEWLEGNCTLKFEAEPLYIKTNLEHGADYWKDVDGRWWGVDVTEDGIAITWCDDK